jgi:hypothetical protein
VTVFLIVLTGGVLFLAALFLPFDWWQKPPSSQRDKLIGMLLGRFVTISLRNVFLRGFFILFFVFMLVITIPFLPLFLGLVSVAVLGHSLVRLLSGKKTEGPVIGLLLLMVLVSLFMVGMIAPARLLSIVPYFLLGRPAGGLWEGFAIGKDWFPIDLTIGVLGIAVVSLWLVIDAVWRFRQASQVENLPTSKIRSLAVGLVELNGIVRPLEGDGTRKTVVETTWSMFDYFNPVQRIQPFYVDDGSGRVLVDAAECRVRAGWLGDVYGVFGVREVVLTKRVIRDESSDAVTRSLREGDRVYVIGNAEENPTAPRDARDVERLVVRPAARTAWSVTLWRTLFGAVRPPRERDIHDVFFLTDADEVNAKKRIMTGFGTVMLFAFIWMAASVGLIWSTTLPVRAAFAPDSWRNASWRGLQPNPNPMVIDYTRNERLFRFKKYIKTVGPKSFDEIPALIEAMGYKDYRFYEPATSALLRMMPYSKKWAHEAVPILVTHLHPCAYNAMSLQMTILALGTFGPLAEPAVPALVEQLQCNKTNTYEVTPNIIRFQAARVLGKIGPAAKDSVPALREALNDPSPAVRSEAQWALRLITGGPPR